MRTIITLLILFAASFCYSQTAVNLAALPGPFLYTNGPNTGGALSFGCVFTYFAGTTNPQDTYTDSSGLTKNQNPVVLNSGGFGQLWFISGSLYDIRVVSSGGTNCISGLTQYSAKSVNGSLLNLPNEWQQTQTFDLPINILAPDLQIVFGNPSGTQTTLDIPPTTGNYILHGPPLTASDTLLSANAIQPVTNKNLTTGTQVNGCGMTNGPGTYICIPNNGSTATVLNSLAILTGAPSTATVAATTTTTGILGVVVAGAGITGNATIQQSGNPNCNFDGATIAGDYVTISSTIAGSCHDSGIGPPLLPTGILIGQILGQVLSTNAGIGAYQVELQAQSVPGVERLISASIPGTFVIPTTANTPIGPQSYPAGTLNHLGAALRVAFSTAANPQASMVTTIYIGFGSSSALGAALLTYAGGGSASTSAVQSIVTTYCYVTVIGSSGSLACSSFGSGLTGVSTFYPTITPTYTVTVDLTQAVYVGSVCSFSVANPANNCVGNSLFLEQLN